MYAWLIMICYYRGNGGWDSSNVMVAEESQNGKIVCHSLHLTCFAVLVDVSVVSGPSDFSSVLKKQVCMYIATTVGLVSCL